MGGSVTGPLVLAIESATARVGCAIGSAEGVLASAHSSRGRRHGESLAPQIRFVTDQAGVALQDLEIVAVDVGPGLYTGLRVGIATGRAMAHMLGVPMVAVTSLEAIAAGAALVGPFAVAVDARRGEVFTATFTGCGSDPGPVGPPAIADPAELAAELAADGIHTVIGDGALAYASVFSDGGVAVGGVEHAWPHPDAVLHLATSRADSAGAAELLQPLYLRRPDAVAKWEEGR